MKRRNIDDILYSKQLQFVTAEQGDRLRAAGFNWPCTMYYDADGKLCEGDLLNHNYGGAINAPTVALALKWMRCVVGIANGVALELTHISSGRDPIYCGEYWADTRAIQTKGRGNYNFAESALLDELLTLIGK